MNHKPNMAECKISREKIDNCVSLNELGDFIVAFLACYINFDRFNIGLLDLENYLFVDAYVYGLNVSGRRIGHKRTLKGSVVEAGLAEGNGIYVGGDPSELLQNFPRFDSVLESGVREMLTVPLYKNKCAVASLVLASIASKSFGRNELELTNEVGLAVVDQILVLSEKDL